MSHVKKKSKMNRNQQPEGDDPSPDEKKSLMSEYAQTDWQHFQSVYVAREVEHTEFKMSWQEACPTGLQWLFSSHVLLMIWIFPYYCKEESYNDSALHAAVWLNTSRRKGGEKMANIYRNPLT